MCEKSIFILKYFNRTDYQYKNYLPIPMKKKNRASLPVQSVKIGGKILSILQTGR